MRNDSWRGWGSSRNCRSSLCCPGVVLLLSFLGFLAEVVMTAVVMTGVVMTGLAMTEVALTEVALRDLSELP